VLFSFFPPFLFLIYVNKDMVAHNATWVAMKYSLGGKIREEPENNAGERSIRMTQRLKADKYLRN